MHKFLAPTIPFVLSTALTGLGCYLVDMPGLDLVIAIAVAALVSGSVAYGTAWLGARQPADAKS